jgi:hypothetical protein
MTAFTRRGASLLGLSVFLVLVPVAFRVAWVSLKPSAPEGVDSATVEVTLIRCGLDAEALAAAGLTSNEVTAVVTAMTTAIGEAPDALVDADAAMASARVAADALTRNVASGLATDQEIANLASAKTTLANAESARATVLNGLFDDATAGLAAGKKATLATIRANRGQELPVEFLAKSRDHTEWHALRQALSNERICAKIGDEPDQSMQSALATWRAEEACAAAKSAFDTNGDAVKTAWDSAVDGG